ncbi:MAG: response regulator transcription factor [Dehalococcoidia bacterium]
MSSGRPEAFPVAQAVEASFESAYLGGRPRLLLVDDAPEIGEIVGHALCSAGLDVYGVQSVDRARQYLRNHDADVALVDVHLPDGSGLDLIPDFSAQAIPVIVMTGDGTRETRLGGFRVGACDVVIKPFDLDELVYRVRVALRRRVGANAASIEGPKGISLSPDRWFVAVDGSEVSLSKSQFMVLRELLERRGEVVTVADLSRAVWGHQTFDSMNYVEIQVSRLRQRLVGAGASDVIRTVRGVGYAVD